MFVVFVINFDGLLVFFGSMSGVEGVLELLVVFIFVIRWVFKGVVDVC